ncbi:MAG TPA: FtsX-like permease family protein [Phnomibacter sp.]|nr:FtsX-like permease family protein [Phnomibacter sp.]
MQVSLFIARRIIHNQQPSFSRFIIRAAAIATAISVATMIVTLSMVNGFQHEVAEKVFSYWGHTRVQNLEPYRTLVAEETPITQTDSLDKVVKATPGIAHVHAFGARSIVLRSRVQFEGVLLKGVSGSFVESPFSRFIRQGSNISFADTSYSRQVLLSQAMARRLDVAVGDTLNAFYLRQGEDIRSRSMTVVGLYQTGIEEYDNQFAIADLRFLQRLNQWDSTQIGGYEIWLNKPAMANEWSEALTENLPQGIISVPITQVYPNIFDWLGIQDQTKRIVIGVMLAVAIINLVTCLLILVMERTRMIALLTAMGMTGIEIRKLFWYYAAWIAGVGVLAGLALGLGVSFLQLLTGIIKMDEATYYVDQMPVKIEWWQVLAVAAGSFSVCLLALRLPLAFIRRISIIKAIRFN